MRLFTYIVVDDKGFAPNPYWGYCTLATCKPAIRRVAKKGDWIVGLSHKALGNKLVYAVRVNEKLTLDEYFKDLRFAAKKPDVKSKDFRKQCGDNIYYRNEDSGEYQQVKNKHHGKANIKRDVGGIYL